MEGYCIRCRRFVLGDILRLNSGNVNPEIDVNRKIPIEEAEEILEKRTEEIKPYVGLDKQTERGRIFEILADPIDDDGALAEMEDLDSLNLWLSELDQQEPP